MNTTLISRKSFGFTLVELLTVIAIIAILMGILFPTINAVLENAKKTQAKNDALQIVNSIKAYYTEYGKYPLASTETSDTTFGPVLTNDNIMNVLRANGKGRDAVANDNLNPRRIVFLTAPDAKNYNKPGKEKSGIGGDSGSNAGQFLDPWGNPYRILIDGNYDNNLTNPYTANAGNGTLNTDVILWTVGRDGVTNSDKNHKDAKDDVISWQ